MRDVNLADQKLPGFPSARVPPLHAALATFVLSLRFRWSPVEYSAGGQRGYAVLL